MKYVTLLTAILFSVSSLSAQSLEFGLFAGFSKYEGDLAPTSFVTNFGQIDKAFGGIARYYLNNFVAAKFGVYYGTVSGDDAQAWNEYRRQRNLSFRTEIFEASLTAEVHFLGYERKSSIRTFSPYIFMGVGGMRFKPTARYKNRWVELQPLGTEGQGLPQYPEKKRYALNKMVFPMGLGIKYTVNPSLTIGLELGNRMTSTDYLDDVSTTYVSRAEMLEARGQMAADLANRSGRDVPTGTPRGDPQDNDWYAIGGIIISYKLPSVSLFRFRGQPKGKMRCYDF